jgi:hypothetical protein
VNAIEWARSAKTDLVALQTRTGIPALFAAAQMCHESAHGDGLSGLARNACNFAGLKWSSWQQPFGCTPVTFGTWEHLNGQNVNLDDSFCFCPSWQVWLKVYEALLTGSFYGGAIAYKGDPLLFGYHVWKRGWATDPAYLQGLAHWMSALMDDYRDTISPSPVVPAPVVSTPVNVTVNGAEVACGSSLLDGRTTGLLRPLAEALGATVGWDAASKTMIVTRG